MTEDSVSYANSVAAAIIDRLRSACRESKNPEPPDDLREADTEAGWHAYVPAGSGEPAGKLWNPWRELEFFDALAAGDVVIVVFGDYSDKVYAYGESILPYEQDPEWQMTPDMAAEIIESHLYENLGRGWQQGLPIERLGRLAVLRLAAFG